MFHNLTKIKTPRNQRLLFLPLQVQERELQQIKGNSMVAKLKEIKHEDDLSRNKFNLAHMKSRIIR